MHHFDTWDFARVFPNGAGSKFEQKRKQYYELYMCVFPLVCVQDGQMHLS